MKGKRRRKTDPWVRCMRRRREKKTKQIDKDPIKTLDKHSEWPEWFTLKCPEPTKAIDILCTLSPVHEEALKKKLYKTMQRWMKTELLNEPFHKEVLEKIYNIYGPHALYLPMYGADAYEEAVRRNNDPHLVYFAARLGHVRALSETGYYFDMVLGDEVKAIPFYEDAAKSGSHYAMHNLATIYGNADKEEAKVLKAVEFYEKVLDHHELGPYAAAGLGAIYFYNEQLRDVKKAFVYCTTSAEAGLARGQYGLARCYQEGFGVEKDLSMAMKYARQAAEKECAHAESLVGNLLPIEDHVGKFYWFKRAADHEPKRGSESPAACYNTARHYENGWGTQVDLSQARHYYEKAAALGDEDAIEWLTANR